MRKQRLHSLILQTCATTWLLACGAATAFAASSSSWETDTHSAVRLLAARPIVESGVRYLRAGVEIKLQHGWKTYGRDPGDSGVPPTFDFAGSDNVKSVAVLWPEPERFAEGDGFTMGYKDDVVFPLRVVPRTRARPVTLRLNLEYAVCEKLCIPAKAKLELVLTRAGGAFDDEVSAAEARVPNPAK